MKKVPEILSTIKERRSGEYICVEKIPYRKNYALCLVRGITHTVLAYFCSDKEVLLWEEFFEDIKEEK